MVLPLLGGAAAATNGRALLMEDRAIVKLAEGCGNGYFRDELGHCHYYGYRAPPALPTRHAHRIGISCHGFIKAEDIAYQAIRVTAGSPVTRPW